MSIDEQKLIIWCNQVDRRLDRLEGKNCKPTEPLIKDEKIRKAVRAWAEANEICEVCYDSEWNSFRMDDFTCSFDYDFDLKNGLVDSCHYTIADLCGKEE